MADEHELRLYGEIGPSWAGMIDDRAVIAALDEMKSSRRIHVRLNSPGGDVFLGVSIANAFRRHTAKIIVHVDALAASAASVIAMGADRVIMHPGAMMMIHRAWTIALGNAEEMAKVADTLAKVDGNLIDLYAGKTGLDKSKLKKLLADETWMSGQEAVEMGFADEVDSAPTGAQAKVPDGWYARTPKEIGRYALPERQKATCGLSIAASVSPEVIARREQLAKLKNKLKVA